VADWPFSPPLVPMEAEIAEELPQPPGWAYEPKWDGFRVVMWSQGGQDSSPRLDSRNAKPLLRYFPELEAALARLPPGTVADGEVVVPRDGKLDFDALLNRIHPAQSRINMLAAETPARLALFDLLALRGKDLRGAPFRERRGSLEELAEVLGAGASTPAAGADEHPVWLLTPSTTDVETARRWFYEFEPAGFDGIVVKALERPYAEGRREMIKVKHRRTVDCVVGGYRLQAGGRRLGSILLGLYNAEGELHFIGHCASFGEAEAAALLDKLLALRTEQADPTGGFGSHARHPGAQSRWSRRERGAGGEDFLAVKPVLVVEVSYDQLTGDRFRHAARCERWRPDKDPHACTMDQLERPKGPALIEALRSASAASPAA
jgi:ATP-dependent DNA ligase